MSTQLAALGGFFGILLAAIFLLVRSSKKQGAATAEKKAVETQIYETNKKNEVVAQQNEQIVKDVEEVHEIHDQLAADPTYADRVQDRFSRD